jgi:hypothetical protein
VLNHAALIYWLIEQVLKLDAERELCKLRREEREAEKEALRLLHLRQSKTGQVPPFSNIFVDVRVL